MYTFLSFSTCLKSLLELKEKTIERKIVTLKIRIFKIITPYNFVKMILYAKIIICNNKITHLINNELIRFNHVFHVY